MNGHCLSNGLLLLEIALKTISFHRFFKLVCVVAEGDHHYAARFWMHTKGGVQLKFLCPIAQYTRG